MTFPSPESTARRVVERRSAVPPVQKAQSEQGARNVRTREAILSAAITLYAAEGYGAVTMRGIAQRLGFSAPAIYNYFLSKEEIFSTLQEIGFELMAETVLTPATDDPLADFLAIFTNYYEFSKRQPEYFALLYVDPAAPHVEADSPALIKMGEETGVRFDRCVAAGIFPRTVQPNAQGICWSFVHGVAVLRRVRAFEDNEGFDPQVTTGLAFFMAGFKAGLLPESPVDWTRSRPARA